MNSDEKINSLFYFELPSSASVGETINIVGKGDNFIISQNTKINLILNEEVK